LVRPLVVIASGVGLLVVAALLVRDPPAALEEAVFRAFNDLPHDVEAVLWVLQQMGSAIVLPFVAILLWRVTRRWQPPVALVTTGFLLGWLGAKVIKSMVGRGRPGAIIDDVILGFDVPITEVGFPSGHAVLAFTLVAALFPYLGRRGRVAAVAVAVLVAATRIYVGAHFPLDVIGGAGYGIAIGTLVTLVSGARSTGTDSVASPTIEGIPRLPER
jgi:undecaprenyl-diphosphatase